MVAVGDTLWRARAESRKIKKTCPVCFGNCRVTVILGDGAHIETPCEYCRKGYELPRGVVYEWEFVADPEPVVIATVEITANGARYNYTDECDWFPTREAAQSRAEEIARDREEEEERRLTHGKEYTNNSYSWHVGYHRREAKECRRRLEWHETRAKECQKRAKEEKRVHSLTNSPGGIEP